MNQDQLKEIEQAAARMCDASCLHTGKRMACDTCDKEKFDTIKDVLINDAERASRSVA